jgi:hypothetical protein
VLSIATEKQLADVLTKPLVKDTLASFTRQLLGMKD